jgi:tRNA uridine 5-carbamoylmethylation protein Kti12
MEMILFIGIPASGKTSFYVERFLATHVRVGMDLLRTRRRERALISACLSCGQRFVVDNTNPARADRSWYIDAARNARFRVVAYFFEPDPKASFERNALRDRKWRVPPAGLFGMLKRLERPTMDEGYDQVFVVHAANGRFDVAPLLARSEGAGVSGADA